MLEKADEVIAMMPGYLEQLESFPLLEVDTRAERGRLIKHLPDRYSGVYVFVEEDKARYVGRSDDIRPRILEQTLESSGPATAAFASRIASHHGCTFEESMKRVRKMQVRAVRIEDCIEQAIFEIYASVVLGTVPEYNNFCNH